MFDSKYPILAACMNGGSDLGLAIACRKAGIFPSICFPRNGERKDGESTTPFIDHQLTSYGSNQINVGVMSLHNCSNKLFIDVLLKHKISHLEIWAEVSVESGRYKKIGEEKSMELAIKNIDKLKDNGTKILKRTKGIVNFKSPVMPLIDALCVKGSDAPGFSNESITTKELFKRIKNKAPSTIKTVIPYGGIGTSSQVKEYMELGAEYVAIGTVFAASKESCLSLELKRTMIQANSLCVERLPDTNQNTFILGDREGVYNSLGRNRQDSLEDGLYGDGKTGHMYAGTSLNYVTEIRSVKDIVEELVKEL